MAIPKNAWTLTIFIVCGLIIGSVINSLITGHVPHSLTRSVAVSVDPPMNLDLRFFRMEFGFIFELNLLSIMGMVLSVLLFRKL